MNKIQSSAWFFFENINYLLMICVRDYYKWLLISQHHYIINCDWIPGQGVWGANLGGKHFDYSYSAILASGDLVPRKILSLRGCEIIFLAIYCDITGKSSWSFLFSKTDNHDYSIRVNDSSLTVFWSFVTRHWPKSMWMHGGKDGGGPPPPLLMLPNASIIITVKGICMINNYFYIQERI